MWQLCAYVIPLQEHQLKRNSKTLTPTEVQITEHTTMLTNYYTRIHWITIVHSRTRLFCALRWPRLTITQFDSLIVTKLHVICISRAHRVVACGYASKPEAVAAMAATAASASFS